MNDPIEIRNSDFQMDIVPVESVITPYALIDTIKSSSNKEIGIIMIDISSDEIKKLIKNNTEEAQIRTDIYDSDESGYEFSGGSMHDQCGIYILCNDGKMLYVYVQTLIYALPNLDLAVESIDHLVLSHEEQFPNEEDSQGAVQAVELIQGLINGTKGNWEALKAQIELDF